MGVCGDMWMCICACMYIAVIFMNCATANSRRPITVYSEKDELLQAKDVA